MDSYRTTVTTTTSVQDERKLFLNTSYVFRTVHGGLKLAQIGLCLLAFICVMITGFGYNSTPDANWMSFVTVCGLMTSAILLFLYFINAVVYFSVINWILLELIYTALWSFFTFVAGVVGAVFASNYITLNHGFEAAAFFLFLAMLVYGYSAFKCYFLYKQGVRLVVVTTEVTTTSTSPVH